MAEDVRRLAEALETAVTGRPAGSSRPSQVVDGIPGEVDEALEAARLGRLDAAGLARALRGTPASTPHDRRVRTWSWRWLAPAALLALLATGIVAIGLVLPPNSESGVLFPVNTTPTSTEATTPSSTTTSSVSVAGGPVSVLRAFSYDPLGDGSEHDAAIPNLTDADPTTAWRTERYFDPLPRLKQGVGVAIEVAGRPDRFEALGVSDGTAYSLLWAETLPPEGIGGWERLASGTAAGERISIQLPGRDNGLWLLWLTDLPSQPDPEGFYAFVAEVRFRP